jgi:hypothetical protein
MIHPHMKLKCTSFVSYHQLRCLSTRHLQDHSCSYLDPALLLRNNDSWPVAATMVVMPSHPPGRKFLKATLWPPSLVPARVR